MAIRKPLKKKSSRAPKAQTKRSRPKPKATVKKARHPRQQIDKTALTERLPMTQTPLFDIAETPSQAVPAPVARQVEVVVAPAPVAQPDQQAEAASPEVPEPVAQTPAVSGEELYNRIQFNAYLLAEKDGFKADPVHYWIQAERAVKAEIRQSARL
jgi:hypothetical protein